MANKPMLNFVVDVEKLSSELMSVAKELEKDLTKGVETLAKLTMKSISTNAENELTSSKETYLKNLDFQEISKGFWVISLNEEAFWIEDGIPANTDMKPKLLNGQQSRVIPFKHNVMPSSVAKTVDAQALLKDFQEGLKKINWERKKEGLSHITRQDIEKNADGSPRIGKLHEISMSESKDPNIARGARGNATRIGDRLQKMQVHQTEDSKVPGGIRRDIVTFRTVTSGKKSAGKWIHPGFEAKNYFDKAYKWAEEKWANEILPGILDKHK